MLHWRHTLLHLDILEIHRIIGTKITQFLFQIHFMLQLYVNQNNIQFIIMKTGCQKKVVILQIIGNKGKNFINPSLCIYFLTRLFSFFAQAINRY